MQAGIRDRRKVQNALEHLEGVACDCVRMFNGCIDFKCYSLNQYKQSENVFSTRVT